MRRAALLALALAACEKSPRLRKHPPAAKAGRNVVLFVGDSLTAGYGVAPLTPRFRRFWGARAKEAVGYRARNAGISGATTAGVLETLDWALAPEVDTAFLCIGANDGLRDWTWEPAKPIFPPSLKKSRPKASGWCWRA